MKKTVSGFIGLMCLIPFMAVAWQMDSSPFRWSTSSIKSSGAPAALQIVLQNKVNMASGTVTINYSLPSGAKNAKLRIYGISGKAVKDFGDRDNAMGHHKGKRRSWNLYGMHAVRKRR